MLFLRGLSVGDACVCQFSLMMLASSFDAGSVGVLLGMRDFISFWQ